MNLRHVSPGYRLAGIGVLATLAFAGVDGGRAHARGTTPPTLDAAHDYIQDALIQRGIDQQAERWLQESHARVRISKMLDEEHP